MGQRCLIGFLLALGCQLGIAAESSSIYVERTESGAVRFTDQPNAEDASLHRLTPPLVVSLPEPRAEERGALAAPQVEILAPRDDEAIRSNHGELKVRAQSSAPDQTPFVWGLLVDGALLERSGRGEFVLQNVDRGTHRLKVRLMNPEGDVLAESDEVRFHMLRYAIPRH